MPTCEITRLAPSPTGALHLGNARTFLVNYLLARRHGWRVLMRVEDIDGPRVKAGAAAAMLEELTWLGLEWEQPVIYQTDRAGLYRQALERLIEIGAAYPCTCSRKDASLAAGAPHADDGATAYPGTCRGRYATFDAASAAEKSAAWRARVDDSQIAFRDEFAGEQTFNLSQTCGDFVIFKGDGAAAYQLAVTVDDARCGVNAVVRGDDLLESAARQIHLRRLLGLGPTPRYWHLPLVVGPDGRRLAKRHGDTRLSHYRRLGATPQRLLGLLGHWSGAIESRREASMDELLERFDVSRMPRGPIVFGQADEQFLRGQ